MYNSQLQYELVTDPLWDKPAMTEIELEVSKLPADKLAVVEQEAEDLGCGCTLEQAYISLIETGVIRR